MSNADGSVADLAPAGDGSRILRSDDEAAIQSDRDGRVENGLPAFRNRHEQVLAKIFASERFKAWTRDIAERAQRERERRSAIKPTHHDRPYCNVAESREHGTYWGKP